MTYTGTVRLRRGEVLNVRPIRAEDEPAMVRFHRTLSEGTVYSRYAGIMKLDTRTTHERLARICAAEKGREVALVAERPPRGPLPADIVAVARLVRLPETREAEFALVLSDDVQGQGLGRALLARLFEVGGDWGIERLVAHILPDNLRMRRVCKSLGFRFHGAMGATKDLSRAALR